MTILDKNKLLSRFDKIDDLTLELGCGSNKRDKDAVGIDIINYDCVDIVGDVYEVLKNIPDNKVSFVYSHHFFEHLRDIEIIMSELSRVMKAGGRLIVEVPHFSNPYFYSDYTHKSRFGLYSFSYLSNDSIFSRKVPNYGKNLMFDLHKVQLVFKSSKPFYFRWGIKKIFQIIFNLNRYMMEFYEENLCYIIPCYEVKYEMINKKKMAS